MMHVGSLIYFLAWITECMPLLEQPVESCLPKIKPLATVLSLTGATRTQTWHGSFGGKTPEPLQLWHVNALYHEMWRPKPTQKFETQLVTSTTSKTGKKQFTGAKDMKDSQEYSEEFCKEVARITCEIRDSSMLYIDD